MNTNLENFAARLVTTDSELLSFAVEKGVNAGNLFTDLVTFGGTGLGEDVKSDPRNPLQPIFSLLVNHWTTLSEKETRMTPNKKEVKEKDLTSIILGTILRGNGIGTKRLKEARKLLFEYPHLSEFSASTSEDVKLAFDPTGEYQLLAGVVRDEDLKRCRKKTIWPIDEKLLVDMKDRWQHAFDKTFSERIVPNLQDAFEMAWGDQRRVTRPFSSGLMDLFDARRLKYGLTTGVWEKCNEHWLELLKRLNITKIGTRGDKVPYDFGLHDRWIDRKNSAQVYIKSPGYEIYFPYVKRKKLLFPAIVTGNKKELRLF